MAASAGTSPVGVDVESIAAFSRPSLRRGLIERALSSNEAAAVRAAPEPHMAFLRQWVRKESLVKVGVGSVWSQGEVDLSDVPVDADAGRPRTVEAGGWHLTDWTDEKQQVVIGVAAKTAPAFARLTHSAT